MKYNSLAISLTYSKYSEKSVIANLFTKEKGLQSFIVRNARSKKSKLKLGFFQPLQACEINATFSKQRNLQYLQEISLVNIKHKTILLEKNDFIKIFIAEVFSKILIKNEKDDSLFEYAWNLVCLLNKKDSVEDLFPIVFLLKLSSFFGFYPSYENSENNYFDLEKGSYVSKHSTTSLSRKNSEYLACILKNEDVKIPKNNREELLNGLLLYYKLQHHELKNLRSHIIIESLKS